MTEELLAQLKKSGWNVKMRSGEPPALAETLWSRYRHTLARWLAVLGDAAGAANREETVWLLCAEDYNGWKGDAFRWDEWERLSLDSAAGDPVWEAEIRRFWESHLPIALSVEGGCYAYYAVSTADGSIVYGSGPEFEECRTVCASPEVFLTLLSAGKDPSRSECG